MAHLNPRLYLALALPATVLVATFFWLKKNKNLIRKDSIVESDCQSGDDYKENSILGDEQTDEMNCNRESTETSFELPAKDEIVEAMEDLVIKKDSFENTTFNIQNVDDDKVVEENTCVVTDSKEVTSLCEGIDTGVGDNVSHVTDEVVNSEEVVQMSSGSSTETSDSAVIEQQVKPETQTDTMTSVNCSDAQSEGSNDSGKGGSEFQASHESSVNNSQPQSPLNSELPTVYEFELPQDLCGRLIGKKGKQINQIRNKSHCNMYIRKIPFNDEFQICVIEGLQSEIDVALEQIRYLFPLKNYSDVTLLQVNAPLVTGVPVPLTIQLTLPDGILSDVILSSMVNAAHFFVQQPTHPTYPSLTRLDQCMNSCYSFANTPLLPDSIDCGMICVAPLMGGWFRAQVMSYSKETEECSVKFVDYGGYSQFPYSELRQIRSDFMPLPFQASECYLANISPTNASEVFSPEACAAFEDLAQGQILQLQIAGYAEDGLPCVNLYRVQGVSTVFINQELCRRGFACWIENPSS